MTRVSMFGEGDREARVVTLNGSHQLRRELVGGKAWGINHMRFLGIPVPPAVVLTTAAWRDYVSLGSLSEELWTEILASLRGIEEGVGRRYGAAEKPLLVSVRSGAAESMPGMMDTILNLGINEIVEAAIARETGDVAFSADTRRRFNEQFGSITEGASAPDDPLLQLRLAITSVFDSWHSPRAVAYRHHRGLNDSAGTAVTIQAMVFGNRDRQSGTGVLFSRNPLTGASVPMGEWLLSAQGEDVVSGRATPEPIATLANQMPTVYAELLRAAHLLENDRRDMQDIEFTIESGQLWLLQTRNAKRSAVAAVRIAVEMCEAGIIDPDEALSRVSSDQARVALRPRIDVEATESAAVLASGEPACPGFVSGVVVTDPDAAMILADAGEAAILVRETTSPEDIHGMIAAHGIITATGGSTSHAAVVSREIGRPCVVGCGEAIFNLYSGRAVTIDGGAGLVYQGRLPITTPNEGEDPWLAKLSQWAANRSPLIVYNMSEAVPPHATMPSDELLDDDVSVRSAVDNGRCAVRATHRLPALLTAVHRARCTFGGSKENIKK